MSRLRTFIAVDPGKAIRNQLVALQEALTRAAAEVNWTEPDNLRHALLFLGEVDQREVPAVCRVVRRVTTSSRPLHEDRGRRLLSQSRRPRIVWAGVADRRSLSVRCTTRWKLAWRTRGYRRENAVTPHLTLGRECSLRAATRISSGACQTCRLEGWRIDCAGSAGHEQPTDSEGSHLYRAQPVQTGRLSIFRS